VELLPTLVQQLARFWQEFDRYSASCGPSAAAELLVGKASVLEDQRLDFFLKKTRFVVSTERPILLIRMGLHCGWQNREWSTARNYAY